MHDAQLLEDYVTRNSETAFQSLVARYLNLVRSTALRQVRDVPLAEDVAQAVFILLARKAARLRKTKNLALGGWLYRTTRFVAARASRGELRRQRREQEAFQMQQISSADETWRRIAPLLDEGIEQLDQTGRDAVILRFLQDETLQKVGDALGISEEAARKRVNRSLDKLRAFFGRRGFTIPTAALAAALAGSRAEAAPAGLAGAIGAKALAHAASPAAMLPALVAETLQAWQWAKMKMLAGIAAGVTVAATSVLLTSHSWTPPPLTPAAPPAAKLVINTPPAARQSATATPAMADKRWHFSFQAVDAETGRGIPRAAIIVVSAKDENQFAARPQTVDVQTNLHTDALGRCDIGLPYQNPVKLIVGVAADGYEERCAFGDSDHPLPDGYTLRILPGFSIGGIVRDETGKPVTSAGIQILFDGTGPGLIREFQRERFGPPGNGYGVVATTDSAGRWNFARCSGNRGFRVVANLPDFPIAIFQEDGGARLDPGGPTLKLNDLRAGNAVLVLKAGLTLRGQVTDEHGYRVAGATVCHDRVVIEGHGVLTESDGSFVLPALTMGTNIVTITANGFAPQRIPVKMASNTAPLAVQLKPGGVLRLRVTDEAGSPLSEALVSLDFWQAANSVRWSGSTDSGGRLVWNSAPLDPITLSVEKEDHCGLRDINLTADGREHIITLRSALTVTGHVTDGETKQPIASFKVTRASNIAYGTNGQFELKTTEYYHEIVVIIEAPGYEPAVSPAMDAKATNLTCNVELKRLEGAGPIDGVAFLPDASVIGGVQVALCPVDGTVRLAKGSIGYPDDERAIETDSQGHFHFEFPFGARALVAVHREGVGSVLLSPANRSISIRLQPWGRIEGSLRLRTRPNAGQQILLGYRRSNSEQMVNPVEFTAKTDAEGNFAFDQAPPGPFVLYLSDASHRTPVEIQPGATTVVQIGGIGDIVSGRLVLSNSDQPPDWSKRLLNPFLQPRFPVPPGLSPSARTEWFQQYEKTEEGRARVRDFGAYPMDVRADGTFTVEDVPPGDYELSGQVSDTAIDLFVGFKGHAIASFRQDVTVPRPSGGQSTETIDLGAIPVQAGKP